MSSLSLEGRVSVHSALQLPPPGCLGLTWFVPPTRFPSLSLTHSFSSRAKVATADGPPGIPTQNVIPVKHTVKIDKDTLLQDYGFHISESLPLTVVSVTAGRGGLGNKKDLGCLWGIIPGSLPVSLCCNIMQKMLPQEVRKGTSHFDPVLSRALHLPMAQGR